MARRHSHPLPNWRKGTAPQPQQEPFSPEVQADDADYSVNSVPWMWNIRATKAARAALGEVWTPRHDRLAKKYLQLLREGKPLPDISPRSAGVPYAPDMQLPSHLFPHSFG